MESAQPNYYETLGLHRRCTPAEIATAYRALAKKFHPDVNSGASDAAFHTQQLNAAYEVLSDPARRRGYDRQLQLAEREGAVRAGRIERNISHDVNLRIEDFFRGATLDVVVRDPGNPNAPEFFTLAVPPMTSPGARFRLPREAPCEGGYVEVRVRALPSARWKVRGTDLRTDLRITAPRAVAGGTEMIGSPTGSQLRLQIPAGVKRGEVLTIGGEGLPKGRGGRGDLLVRVTYRAEVRVTRR
ncbi:MAG: DnaJ domain-containing protein [Verrucomicrobiota bacterium]|nr:DnaJ domain-containing protein [Verrucomicrobiota bacterium]